MRHLKINQFGGGQNTRLSADRLDEGEAVQAHNVDLDSGALVSTRDSRLDWDPGDGAPNGPVVYQDGATRVTYANRGDIARCAGREYRLERGVESPTLKLLGDDLRPTRAAGIPWVDSSEAITNVTTVSKRVAKFEVTREGNGVLTESPFDTGEYYGYVVQITLSHVDQAILQQIAVGMRLRVNVEDRLNNRTFRLSDVEVVAVGDVTEVVEKYARPSNDEDGYDVLYSQQDLSYQVEVLCSGTYRLGDTFADGLFLALNSITLHQFRYNVSINQILLWFNTLYHPQEVLLDTGGGNFLDYGHGIGETSRETLELSNGTTGPSPRGSVTIEEYASGTISRAGTEQVEFSVTDDGRGLFPLLTYYGLDMEVEGRRNQAPSAYTEHKVSEEQESNFLSALGTEGEYAYACTIVGEDGRESAPFAPGDTQGVVLEINDTGAPIITNNDPEWWPVPLANTRNVAEVTIASYPLQLQFQEVFGEESFSINVYRTSNGGTSYYLVGNVASEFQDVVFTDSMIDFTLLQQPSLQTLDSYPPHLRANDAGNYSYTYEDRFLLGKDGVLYLLGGNRVSFSKLNRPEEWGLLDWIELPDTIVAAAIHGQFLVAFCDDGTIWRIVGNTAATIAQEQLEDRQRNLSHDCTTDMGSRLVFPGTDGICLFDGIRAIPVTRPKKEGLALPATDCEPHAVVHDGVYYLWTGDSATNYRMEILANGIQLTTFESDALHSAVDTENNQIVVVRGTGFPGIYGNGDQQEMHWISRLYRAGNSHYPVHFGQFWMDYQGTGRVTVYVDGEQVLTDQVSSTERAVKQWRFPAGTRGRHLQVEVRFTGTVNEFVASSKQLRTSPLPKTIRGTA